jgi:serine/threonine-protein kinase
MPQGAAWGNNDSIIVTEWQRISSVSASGGPLRTLSLSKGKLKGDLFLPEWLPEYRAMLLTLQRSERSLDLVLYDTKRREISLLVEGGFNGHYVDGYVIYARQNGVFAAPFDIQSLTITGEEILISTGVAMYPALPAAHFAVGSHAPFLYVPSDRPAGFANRSFAWVDRNGAITDLGFPQAAYFDPSLSPDGKRFAFHDEEHIWIADVDRQTKTRFTDIETKEWAPIWTPNGKNIITSLQKDSGFALVIRNVAGGAAAELKSGILQAWPNSVSYDGRFLAYTEYNVKTGADIIIMSLTGEHKTQPFLVTPSEEMNPMFSPDGRWIAYESNESGAYEVYVSQFPASGDKILISDDVGREPRWSRDGRELYYRNGRKTMVVTVDTKQKFHASKAKMLFEGDFSRPGSAANYDVSPGGKRFLVMKGQIMTPAKKINVIVNWQEELRQKMEKKK